MKEKLLAEWKEMFAPGMLGRDDYKYLEKTVMLKWKDVSKYAKQCKKLD